MQKNDQNPPAKNPSYHVKVQLVCGDGPLYIITFSKKNGILGNADFPPNKHTPTRRHADTPTRRHADTPTADTRHTHSQHTHSQHTHTERGLEGGDGRAERGLPSIKAHCSKTVHRTVRAIRARTSQVTQCVGALTRVLHMYPCTCNVRTCRRTEPPDSVMGAADPTPAQARAN